MSFRQARPKSNRGPRGLLDRLYPDPFFISHTTVRREISAVSDSASGVLLDVGCGWKPYRGLFKRVRRYVGVDLPTSGYGLKAVDCVADAQQLPFLNGAFDACLCSELLEHVPEPARVVAELCRVLKPGGVLILTTPQTWGLHEVPRDYFRYTEFGLRHLLGQAGFTVERVTPTCGVWATAGQRTGEAIYSRWAIPAPLPVRLIVLAICVLWLRAALIIDRLNGHWGDTLDNVVLATKAG
jgi:SAM-dependent methyltransferase